MKPDPDATLPPYSLDETPGAVRDLDLRSLRCPLPVLRTRKALVGAPPGTVLRVSCTDPLAGLDIPHLLGRTGDALVHCERSGDTQVFIIRKT